MAVGQKVGDEAVGCKVGDVAVPSCCHGYHVTLLTEYFQQTISERRMAF